MDLETVNSEQGIVNSEDKDKQIGQETCTVIAIPGFSCHSPFTIHHSPFTIHHSPFTIHHSPFTIHRLAGAEVGLEAHTASNRGAGGKDRAADLIGFEISEIQPVDGITDRLDTQERSRRGRVDDQVG